jgi:eukaryotic-like serine/threonine-protein kinase
VDRALKYLDSLSQEARGDLSLQRELATTYERVGDVQGNPYYANLGDLNGAANSYQESLAIRLALVATATADIEAQRQLSTTYARIAVLRYVRSDFAGSEDIYRKCLAVNEKIALSTNTPADRMNLIIAHGNLGFAVAVRGDLTGARSEYSEALAALQKFGPGELPQEKLDFAVAGISERLAPVLMLTGEPRQSVELATSGLKIRQKLSAADPTNATRRQQLAVGYRSVGDILSETSDAVNALQNFQKALEISLSLSSADPTNAQANRIVADLYNKTGRMLTATGNIKQALHNHQNALEILLTLSKADPKDSLIGSQLADCYIGFGLAHMAIAENADSSNATQALHWVEARQWFQRTLEQWVNFPGAIQGISQLGSVRPERIKHWLKQCDAALAKLGAPLH